MKPFQRLARTLQQTSSEEASSTNAGGGEEKQAHDFLNTGALKALKDFISGGNNIEAYRKLTNLVDLEKAWQSPIYLQHIQQAVPMVKTIKGVGEIFSKETVTPADVRMYVVVGSCYDEERRERESYRYIIIIIIIDSSLQSYTCTSSLLTFFSFPPIIYTGIRSPFPLQELPLSDC